MERNDDLRLYLLCAHPRPWNRRAGRADLTLQVPTQPAAPAREVAPPPIPVRA